MNAVQNKNENERLDALRSLDIMHSERMPEFDAVVETIASIFECPIALISLVDKEEQWFKARCGLDVDGTSRDVSFCQHALTSDELFVVNDAFEDARFRENPLVTGEPNIRFYAGCPLSLDGKNFLGTLCVIDRVPRNPTQIQLDQLKRLGRIVEGLIKSHRAIKDKERAFAEARAEHELAIREGDLLAEVTNVSGVGGWELCLKTNQLTWTSKTREIHEVDDDFEPDVERALEFYPPDSREQISKAIETAIDAKTGWDVELPFLTAKGRDIWVRAAGRPVVENGDVTRLVGAFQDITERKETYNKIRNSELIQRKTLQSLSEGIMLLSRSGTIQSINAAGAKLLGYTPDELIGSRVRDLGLELQFDGKGKSRSSALLQLAATHPNKVNDVIAHVVREGKSEGAWLRVNATPLDADNEFGVDGAVVSLKDVTESRRQSDTLQAIFDNFPFAIAYHDKSMHLYSCNDAYKKSFDLPDELIARKPHRRELMMYMASRGDYGDGDPTKLVDERMKQLGTGKQGQTERCYPDGTIMDIRSTPLPDGGQVFSFFDITERKRAEETISRSDAVQRTTLEALSEGILLLSRTGEILSANPAAAELIGYTDGNLIGLNVDNLELDIVCDIEGIGERADPLSLAARDPHIMSNVLAKHTLPGGSQTIWLRINAQSIDQDSETGFDGIVVSLTNITETKQQADTLQIIFDNFPGGVAHYDENSQLASCNAEYSRLLGFPKELTDQKLHMLDYLKYTAETGDYGPGEPEQLALERFEGLRSGKLSNFERGTAGGKYLEIRSTPLPTGGSIYNFFDVTGRKKMEKELEDSERLARHRLEELEAILANMRQGVSVFDSKGKLTLWNQQYLDIFGKSDRDVKKGISLLEIIETEKSRGEFDGDVSEHVMDLMIRLSAGEVVRSKFTHSSGKIISVIQAPLPGGGWIGTHEDITLREQAAAKITHAAHHDELTGLANRTLFNATLNESLVSAQIQGTHGHLMLMDLDKFKPVNDTYGHDVGDELLKQASQRVKNCIRSSDLVARIGGDEFAIVLKGTDTDRATEIAERIVQSLQVPFNVFAHKIQVGVSIGIAKVHEDAVDGPAIIKEADIALYDVKRNGRNGFQFFEDAPVIRAVHG